jgi:hypothetical protein
MEVHIFAAVIIRMNIGAHLGQTSQLRNMLIAITNFISTDVSVSFLIPWTIPANKKCRL